MLNLKDLNNQKKKVSEKSIKDQVSVTDGRLTPLALLFIQIKSWFS